MSMSQEELEAKLKAMHAHHVAAQSAKEQTSGVDFSPEDKYVLKKGYNVLRIVDLPVEINFSFIKGDEGKMLKVILPNPTEDPSHLLYRIMDRVLVTEWGGRDSKNKPILINPVKDSHPLIYQMVYNNEETVEGQYGPNGWGIWGKRDNGKRSSIAKSKGSLINVIPRMPSVYEITRKDKDGNEVTEKKNYDYQYCIDNNHTLLLTRSEKTSEAPITVYNILMDEMFTNFGSFFNYDIAIKRLSEDPWYQIFKADTLQGKQELQKYVVEGPLTEQELGLEKYDLQALSTPTSYTKIYNHMKGKIKTIDEALGTDYLNELENLVEEEGTEISSTKSQISTSTTVSDDEQIPDNDTEVDKFNEEKPKKRRIKTSASDSDSVDWDKVKEHTFKYDDGTYAVDKLSESEKEMIKGVDEEGNILFNVLSGELAESPFIDDKFQPQDMDTICIYSGKDFSE